jgi:hypothetical protein
MLEKLLRELLENQVKRTYLRIGTIEGQTIDGTPKMKIVIELRRPSGDVAQFLVENDRVEAYGWDFEN